MAPSPQISTFQMGGGALGNLAQSVNLFRGDVTFPLTFMQVSGPNGLDVKVSATYSGNVAGQVATWNQAAPTGLLGLGWDLPLDRIAVAVGGAAPGVCPHYALSSQGASGVLAPVGRGKHGDAPYLAFVLAQYQPWRVAYFPDDERWEVTHDDGVTYTYGGLANGGNALEYGVRRDAWVGASSLDGGQQFVTAWNLATIRHYWGDTVQFTYERDDVALGGDSQLAYTRAARVDHIVDGYGRTVTYRYLRKEPTEYQPAHGGRRAAGLAGYQDRYDPHYLAAVEVAGPDRTPLLTLDFGYTLASAVDGDGEGRFVKRYLTSVAQAVPGALAAPGVSFRYNDQPAAPGEVVNGLGSLAGIDYPSGAAASYTYGRTQLASHQQAIECPTSGVPRVWFGPDYVVITWYDDAAAALTITPYTWIGSWVASASPLVIATQIADGGASLEVVASETGFAVTYLDATSTPALVLVRKRPGCAGQWTSTRPDDVYAAAADGAPPTQLGFGDDFVVFVPSGSTTIYRYSWDRTTGSLRSQATAVAAGAVSVAARANYYVVMAFEGSGAAMALYHHDLFGDWSTLDFPEQLGGMYVTPQGAPVFSWSLGAAFVAATFADSASDQTTVSYDLRVYHWDVGFTSLERRYQDTLTMPASFGEPPTATVTRDAVIGNLGRFLRYDGAEWLAQELPCNSGQKQGSLFAYGDDVGVATDTNGNATGYAFDADELAFVAIAGLESAAPMDGYPARPTAAGDYLTAGTQIFVRDAERGWIALSATLPGDVNPASIVNRAPAFIAYETGSGTGAAAGIWLTSNGDVHAPADPTLLSGQRIFADKQDAPGTVLCGTSAFVTYPATVDFDQATTLYLHHVGSGAVGIQIHCPVIGLAVDDGYQTTPCAWWYDAALVTFDSSGTVAQYARARTFPGVATAPAGGLPAAAADCPGGFSESRFFNSQAPGLPGLFYPDDTADYYSLLGGSALATTSFASDGRLVSYQLSRYHRFTPGGLAGRAATIKTFARLACTSIAPAFTAPSDPATVDFLDGVTATMPAELAAAFTAAGYALSPSLVCMTEVPGARWLVLDDDYQALFVVEPCSSGFQILAGFSRGEVTEYEPSHGLVSAATVFNRDTSGQPSQHRRAIGYAWQELGRDGQPTYPQLTALGLLTGISRVTETVAGAVTAQTVMTWSNAWGELKTGWSQQGTYQARSADATFVFDPGATPDPTAWTRSAFVTRRNSRGGELESIDVAGVTSSSIYDRDDRLAVAQVTNAGAGAGECSWWGAEPYERNPGWTVQPGGGAPSLRAGTAHTGSQSVVLAPGQTLQLAPPALTPTNGNQRYVFSCWYLTDPGFGGDAGTATVTITVAADGGTATTLPATALGDGGGAWQLVQALIDPMTALGLTAAPSTLAVTIAIADGKAATSLCLDELRLMPLVGDFSGQVVDLSRELVLADVALTGHSTRKVYDRAGNPRATTQADERVVAIGSAYYSRAAHGGAFDAADPNARLTVKAGGGGGYQDFRRSPDWARWWQGDAGAWAVDGGALRHRGTTTDTLTAIDGPPAGDLGVLLGVALDGELTCPLTLGCGELTIAWIPGATSTAAGAWRLGGDAGTDVGPAISCTLPAGYAAVLDRGELAPVVRSTLASLGVRLSSSATAAVISAGAQWMLTDRAAGQRYRVDAGGGGLAVTRLTLPEQELLLTISGGVITFHAGGRPIFQRALAAAPTGAFTVATGGTAGLRDVVIFAEPRLAAAYLDGCGRTIQQQSIELSSTQDLVVQATRYDALGNQVLSTKAMRVSGAGLGYQAGVITAVTAGGQLTGAVNDYYAPGGGGFSDDGGYPCWTMRYGDWPGAGVVEQGQPGAALAITGDDPSANHTGTSSAAAHTAGDAFAALKLPAGDYLVGTTTDADGNAIYELRDRLGDLVARTADDGGVAITTRFARDGRGRVLSLSAPDAAAPRPDTAAQAPHVTTYDFQGNAVSITSPDTAATMRIAYDGAGRVRLRQDAAGAEASPPYVLYWKYDALGRPIESGYATGEWSALVAQLDDAAAPTGTWRHACAYDGDGATPTALGQLTSLSACNGDGGGADVIETSVYDACGRVTSRTITATAWSQDGFTTTYGYDPQNATTLVVYPDGATTVAYGYDRLGRLASVGTAPGDASLATYAYTPTGQVVTETYAPAAAQPLARSYAYVSPGWVAGVRDAFFQETVAYAVEGGATYYNGKIAEVTSAYGWDGAPGGFSARLEFDRTGQLLTAASSELPAGAVGTTAPLTYDANGNLTSMDAGSAASTYHFDGASNRVTGAGAAAFGYDALGAITSATSAGFAARALTRITYDPYTHQPTAMTIGGGPATGLSFGYDGSSRRVLKVATAPDGSTTTTLYLRGAGDVPLVEYARTSGDVTTTWTYVHSPQGAIRVTRDGTPYHVLRDHLGSTRALITAAGTPTAAATYDYAPFGSVIRTSGTPDLMRYLFTGQEYDAESGLYNFRARLYDSQLARFYSLDPLLQCADPYGYAGNDPSGSVDPSGMWSWGALLGIVVSGIEIVVGLVWTFGTGGIGYRLGGSALLGAGFAGLAYSLFHLNSWSASTFLEHEAIGFTVGLCFGLLGELVRVLKPAFKAGKAMLRSWGLIDGAEDLTEESASLLGERSGGHDYGSAADSPPPGADVQAAPAVQPEGGAPGAARDWQVGRPRDGVARRIGLGLGRNVREVAAPMTRTLVREGGEAAGALAEGLGVPAPLARNSAVRFVFGTSALTILGVVASVALVMFRIVISFL